LKNDLKYTFQFYKLVIKDSEFIFPFEIIYKLKGN